MSRRTAFPWVSAGAILIAAAPALLPSGEPVRAAEKRISVQGRITAGADEALAGWPVVLIGTQRYLEFGKTTSGGGVGIVARTSSDGGGYYAFDLPKDGRYQFWFVRFMDPETFDAVKYRPPRDVEITKLVRRGRLARVDLSIALHPGWAEVERRIAEAGGSDTPKGRILRTLGLPEKLAPGRDGEDELWWYFTKGVVYNFRGAEAAGSRRFEPVTPPDVRAEAGAPSGGR